MVDRVNRLLNELAKHQIDAMLILQSENRMYFSGFTGSNGILFISGETRYLITDFRYVEQAKTQCPNFNIIDAPGAKAGEFIGKICKALAIKTLWFEENSISLKDYKSLSEAIKPVDFIPDDGIPFSLRMTKSPKEIASIKNAAMIADQGFEFIIGFIQAGMTEKEIAFELEFFLRKEGSEGLAFPIIAASGINSALPHAQPGEKEIQKGDFLTLDFGCVIDGYSSDMTRTIAIGEPPLKLAEIYGITLDAQIKVLDALKPGLTCLDADKNARDYITQMGYGDYFGHGLGHGVGLYVHEGPTLSPKGKEKLVPGMVVTIEPGIYLPGIGGVRIEDLVVITDDGYQNLTSSRKDLVII